MKTMGTLAIVLVLVGSASGWDNRDIGSPSAAGSASYDGGTGMWTVKASGHDIWGYSDGFHFVYTSLMGDGQITARVIHIEQGAHEWAKAGVMIRQDLNGESKHAMMVMTPTAGHAAAFMWRDTAGGISETDLGGSMALPYWVRIERIGNTLAGYHSQNGNAWTLQGTATIPMGQQTYIGLALTSHEDGILRTAEFDNVTIDGETGMGTAFTYQGRLLDDSSPADGLYDFEFKLYDSNDVRQGSTVDINDLDVIDGYFTARLDFGSGVFDGAARWLDIGVRPGDSTGGFTALSPRQEVTPVPYALQTRGISVNNAGDVGIGTTNPSEKLDVNGNINVNSVYKIGGATVLSNRGTDNVLVGKDAGINITTGERNSAMGYQALYSNIHGRYNSAMGSRSLYSNTEGSYNSAVGYQALYSSATGNGNSATGYEALRNNTAGERNSAMGHRALYSNTTGNSNVGVGFQAGNSNSTGSGNVFLGFQAGYNETGSGKLYIANSSTSPPLIYGDFSTGNVGIGTTTPAAKLTVGGGILRSGSTMHGANADTHINLGVDSTTGLLAGDRPYATVGGGRRNTASGQYATVGGGTGNTAREGGATVGGGEGNTASGSRATVGGGYENYATASEATVGGGMWNMADGPVSTIGGGNSNMAEGLFATVGGGQMNFASGEFVTVGGGEGNLATAEKATVGGGKQNDASGVYATVAGGMSNAASAGYATVSGGSGNAASVDYATVGGGGNNTASGSAATVGGGGSNTASGSRATVSGGEGNTAAGNYSFAAGLRAKANNKGAFVWADSTGADFASTDDNQFLIRAAGGVGIGTNSPNGALDVNGSIYQRGGSLHADYVFEPGYELESIEEHSEHMWREKHLSAIPRARCDETGREIVEVGSHRKGIVEELEKAHIYIDQLNKQNKELETRLAELESTVAMLTALQKGAIK